ncbi:calcium-binding protein [Methylobacterium sp. E-045]|uniref:calcium-binding protein n=1 Tax=Methylobacterium sp. E-045 TaxID=2836575 RepID=UPI001FBB50A9|nr:calcium-binding protein [Methylobacterium sp. E-045]MCJ2131442.1 calcium-binding protein [Methylobacterium sp. E-045]
MNIQNVIGSAKDDVLNGSLGNNVFEGGAGADAIRGNGGIDTASYNGSSAGVNVNLSTNVNAGGDAEGDLLFDISNLFGSKFADTLTGDGSANTLTGNGGGDALYGMAGNDRLVITDTPTMIDGGSDKDFLFVSGGGSVSLSESTFTGIESVYVRNDTHLDMSQVITGSRIASQSTVGHGVEIIGTSGADTIKAGKGGDAIEGGAGGDKLFAGAGSDTFHFQAGFGRDNVYKFDVATDHITVDIAGATGVTLKEFHGGQDTIVTFAGVEGANKIILHDVTVAEIHAGPSDLFTFGA